MHTPNLYGAGAVTRAPASVNAGSTSLTFVEVFLRETLAAQVLMDQINKMHARKKPLSRGEAALENALWEGRNALRHAACQSVRRLMERGQLLYAWEGTTVVSQEGGAA